MTVDDSWFDEIDLDPAHSSRTMGTRALGDRPWLVADSMRQAELDLKAHLCADRHADVFAALGGTEPASATVEALVRAAIGQTTPRCPIASPSPGALPAERPAPAGADVRPISAGAGEPVAASDSDARRLETAHLDASDDELHPLDRAGRLVQEDLCLLGRRDDGWHLEAASLCFPSRWRLADKIGRHITEVHTPVEGYATELADRVDRLFDRLTDRPVWRRNWFVHPDASLFQPAPPPAGDPVIGADHALDDLVVRSERQTLRRLPDTADHGRWALFTIRVQQVSLGQFCADDDRRRALEHFLRGADPTTLAHRAIAPAQADEILAALAT